MFTGLIEDLGEVLEVRRDDGGALLRIGSKLAADLSEGDSIAVNGVCLTATEIAPSSFAAEAMVETLRSSSLSDLERGAKVNLELPLRAGERLGGHIVQGHVDGVAEVREVREEGFSRVLTLRMPEGLGRHLVHKGSIALHGVSLTISGIDGETVSVSLIPKTISETVLGAVQPGDRVNVEVDVLAKHVEALLRSTLSGR